MAAAAPRSSLTNLLRCSVCSEIYTDPISLPCQHTFCQACLQRSLDEHRHCPLCKAPIAETSFQVNRNIGEMADALRQLELRQKEKAEADRGTLCPEHGERLRLYCETDRKVICLVCREGKDHRGHFFKPLKEAQEDLMRDVAIALDFLEADVDFIKQGKKKHSDYIKGIKARQEELRIKIGSQFAEVREQLKLREEQAMKKIDELLPDSDSELAAVDTLMRSTREREAALKTGLNMTDSTSFLQWWVQGGQVACKRKEEVLQMLPLPRSIEWFEDWSHTIPPKSLLGRVDFEGLEKDVLIDFKNEAGRQHNKVKDFRTWRLREHQARTSKTLKKQLKKVEGVGLQKVFT